MAIQTFTINFSWKNPGNLIVISTVVQKKQNCRLLDTRPSLCFCRHSDCNYSKCKLFFSPCFVPTTYKSPLSCFSRRSYLVELTELHSSKQTVLWLQLFYPIRTFRFPKAFYNQIKLHWHLYTNYSVSMYHNPPNREQL